MSETKTWGKRIRAARRRGYFTQEDHYLAWDWTQCSVGEHSDEVKAALTEYFDLVERNNGQHVYEPVRMPLEALGCNFGGAVNRNEIDEAARIHRNINRWFKRHAVPS